MHTHLQAALGGNDRRQQKERAEGRAKPGLSASILKKFMLNQNSSNNTKATELHHVTTFQKTDKMANLLILHELEWDTFLDHI